MTEDQADQIIGLLQTMSGQLQDMQAAFLEFTNYNAQSMKATVEDITGPTRYNLEDLHKELVEIGVVLTSINAKAG
ncbi:MAG: hypothetical protein K0R64_945 [Novosphingobium lindaniclasticum]|jgi:hypothetical protein|uniref:hypothetical protein n=1 Tax=Novosphingobium lindaniclasticum TaxID=1329895 RepID=UPI002409C461|nr:hypothetical protein [Novosphingobium lindaniclasticum]MDF2637961.1 hypothetical protein [Novosphingobium lindaniclasticum]